jgi:hypothetical protein
MEDSTVMPGRADRDRPDPVAVPASGPGEEMILMGVPRQDPDTSFAAYRQAIVIAEASRQQAIAAALADHRRVLEDIEAAYRHAVAAARWRYSQRMTSPGAAARHLRQQRQHAAGVT